MYKYFTTQVKNSATDLHDLCFVEFVSIVRLHSRFVISWFWHDVWNFNRIEIEFPYKYCDDRVKMSIVLSNR